MLGSAQCQRCGASLLGADAPSIPEPAPAIPVPTPGHAPPPPPPPGYTPPPPVTTRPRRAAGPSVKASSGCGCLVPLLLLVLLPAGAGVLGAFSAVGDAIDGAGGGGDLQDEGVLVLDVRDEGGIGDGERDRWTFEGDEDIYRFSVFADGDFDPVVEVLEESGRSIGRDDDGGDDRDSQLDVPLAGGEVYQVIVSGFGSSSGDYEILVEPARPDPVLPPVDGGALTIGREVRGEVARGGSVRYRFVGEGRTVAISAIGIDGFDPTVAALTSDGLELGFDDDGGSEPLASLLQVDVAGGQTVIIEVAGFGGEDGEYRLEVR